MLQEKNRIISNMAREASDLYDCCHSNETREENGRVRESDLELWRQLTSKWEIIAEHLGININLDNVKSELLKHIIV